jgi:hypothetical protein
MKKLFYLPILCLAMACGNSNTADQTTDQDSVPAADEQIAELTFSLTVADGAQKDKLLLAPGDYSFEFSSGTIQSAFYNGFVLEFQQALEKSDKYYLRFILPAASKMKIYQEKEAVKAEMPAVPFKVTEKDFKGVYIVETGMERPGIIQMETYLATSPGHIKSTTYDFNIFEMEVTRADFGKDKFSMDATFSGTADEQLIKATGVSYSIKGKFSVKDKSYQYM